MTEAARAPVAGVELFHDFELDLLDRNEHHLCNPFSGLNFVAFAAAIPAGNEYLSLVVRIDKPREVSQHESVFVTQP